MAARPQRDREPEFEGGAQPVPERPPDEPGKARGPVFTLVAILGVLTLVMPILWGLGALATVGTAVGTAGVIALWIVWGICLVAFLFAIRALWRRAA
jgi:hypothetical protein